MRLLIPAISTLLVLLMLALPAAAHVPVLPGDHNSLDTAMPIQDAAISYAIYGTLHEAGEADYYTVYLRKGDGLNFMVNTPVQGNFLPWLVIAGPGLSPQGTVPQGVVLPAGDTTMVIPGTHPASADYEPFSPMAIYQTAMYTGNAPSDGTYVIAVYTPAGGGPYTLAAGSREAFTASEWILVPVDLIGVRIWQGQSLLLIFGPYLAVFGLAAGFLVLRPKRRPKSPAAWSGLIAGLSCLGSGAALLLQTGIALRMAPAGAAVLVTLAFTLIAFGAGAVAVRVSVQSPAHVSGRFRILMALVGIVGIAAWAGLIIGPVFAFAAALMPDRQVLNR